VNTDDEIRHRVLAMERHEERRERERQERRTAETIAKATEPRVAVGSTTRKRSEADVPTLESTLSYAEAWLQSDGDGMTHDQFIATCFASALQRIAPVLKAATAFVDEQGKRVRDDGTLIDPQDFAAGCWRDLVRALEGPGR
jgi:hypothetical protein